MNCKKRMILGVCFLLLVTLFTGCGKDSQKDVLELVPKDQAEDTVATVNGEAITVSDMQYYIYQAAMLRLYQLDPTFQNGIQGTDWNQKTADGKTLTDAIKEDAFTLAANQLLTIQNGKKANYAFPDAPKKQIEDSVEQFLKNNDEEIFLLNLTAMGVNSKDAYVKLLERATQVENVQKDVQANMMNYLADTSILKEYKSDTKATVHHVLILNKDGKYENPLDTAQEVLEKAKGGEDFAKLVKEYNEDPGATEAGYTFGPGEMVKEFEEASFALGFDEISDIVETTYGYHIIKRVAGAAELESYWLSQAEIEKNEETYQSLSVRSIMETIDQAQNELRNQAKGE